MADTPDNGAASTSSGSTSAASAMASAASSAATAAGAASSTPSTPAGGQPAAATPPTAGAAAGSSQPAQQPGQHGQQAAGARGPIPFDAHQRVLANLRRQYQWTEGLNPQEVREAVALRSRLHADPRAFWQQLAREIGPGDEPDEALPKPDLQSEDGRFKTYSAESLDKYWSAREKQLTRRLMGELQPFIQGYQQDKTRQQQEAQTAQGRRVVNDALAHIRTMPHFKENERAIAEKLEAMDERVLNSVGLVGAMHMAYNAVLAETVLPSYQQTAEQKVREENARKAGTQGSAHPAASVTTGAGKLPSNPSELAAHMERLEREGVSGRF